MASFLTCRHRKAETIHKMVEEKVFRGLPNLIMILAVSLASSAVLGTPGSGETTDGASDSLTTFRTTNGVWFGAPSDSALHLFAGERKAMLTIEKSGDVCASGSMWVEGTTITGVLTITGGADLAEPFPVADSSYTRGAVMVIDRNHPGCLVPSERPYDTCVAGVISGAGGVQPGLTLRQEHKLDEGPLVALSGRVYVLATTMNGNIQPGDLLTTSNMKGHSMKATDSKRSHGAIIGKAMTPLADGEGLVLVLVNLQ